VISKFDLIVQPDTCNQVCCFMFC